MRPTKARIDLGLYRHNIRVISKKTGGRKICLVVKANAYGHGSVKMAKVGIEAGAQALGVATVDEALELREAGIAAPIFLFTVADVSEVPRLVRFDITPFASDLAYIKQIEQEARNQGKVAEIHLKVDTGMGRLGCRPEEALSLASFVGNSKNLMMGGICTHFSVSDISDRAYTLLQINRLDLLVETLKSQHIPHGLVHAANTGAIIQYPEAYYDMVRPGLGIFGYPPDLINMGRDKADLRPVLSMETKIGLIKTIKKGESVSYGRTFVAENDTHIGVVAAGFCDGYPRSLSNKGFVTIKEKHYPVIGMVCMDQLIVDLGRDLQVGPDDTVMLLGHGRNEPTMIDLTQRGNVIVNEVICRIPARVPKVYINE